MLRYGPLADQVTVGEVFTRLPNDGLIETVTSSAMSRLGNPLIFTLQDETGTYTDQNKLRKVAETQRRGAAGMGGRSIETTNPWDPGEDSVAQRTWESKRPDVFKFWRNPDREPSLLHDDGTLFRFSVTRERRAILRYVYLGAEHVDIPGIEAEALELMEKDPGQAERFFGNRVVAGHGAWCPPERWDGAGRSRRTWSRRRRSWAASTAPMSTTGPASGLRPRTATSSRRGSPTGARWYGIPRTTAGRCRAAR